MYVYLDPSLSLNIILLCVIRIYAEVPVWNSKENRTDLPSKLDKSDNLPKKY